MTKSLEREASTVGLDDDDTLESWTGVPIGPGPIVIFRASQVAQTGGCASLVAGTAEGPVVNLPLIQLPFFLRVHESETFLSPDCDAPSAAIASYPNLRQPEAALVCACIGASRWLDLGSLDLLARVADGKSLCKTRTEAEITSHYRQITGSGGDNRSQIHPDRDRKSPHRDRIRRTLGVFEWLKAELGRMHEETTLPSEPEYRLTPPSPEELESLQQQSDQFLRHRTQRLRDERVAAGLPAQPEDPDPVVASDTASTRMPPLLEPGFGGAESLLRGQFATRVLMAQPNLFTDRVERARIPDLREAAEKRYQFASRELHRCLGEEVPRCLDAELPPSELLRRSFHWDGDLVARVNGHPCVTKSLPGWLRRAACLLVDRLNEQAPVPRNTDGQPTRNPEHWGCWAACDRALWSWRELTRMAETLRFASSQDRRSPRYEIVPRLRSLEPNLEVYRQLRVPVLRARPGHVLLAGRVRDLRLRCFAAVGLRREYFSRGTSRLAGYLLGFDDPFAMIAAELAAASYSDVEMHNCGHTTAIRECAAQTYAAFRQDEGEPGEPEQAERRLQWQRQTERLVNAAILGVPESSLVAFLECEYQTMTTTIEATRLLKLLASEVVYELGTCLEDRTTDIVWARLARSSQDELTHRASAAYPDTFAGHIRNELNRSSCTAVLNLGPDTHPAPDAIVNATPVARGGAGLYQVRGRTLGGRLTTRGTRPVVLQQEVLGSTDDVMLEVAYEILAGGYHLLGIAGEEFVVEVPEGQASEAERGVAKRAVMGAERLLGRLRAPVSVGSCYRW